MGNLRTYTVSFNNTTLTAAMPIVFLNPKANGAGSTIEVVAFELSQNANVTSIMERIDLFSQASVFPTMVTATPVPVDISDPASAIVGGTAGAAGTVGIAGTVVGAGTKTVIASWAFNVLNGFTRIYVPEERPRFTILATGQGFGFRFTAGPTTLTGWNMTLTYSEM